MIFFENSPNLIQNLTILVPSVTQLSAPHVDIHHVVENFNVPHYDTHTHFSSPAVYPVRNNHEAALVYDNIVAPNPDHYHSPVI